MNPKSFLGSCVSHLVVRNWGGQFIQPRILTDTLFIPSFLLLFSEKKSSVSTVYLSPDLPGVTCDAPLVLWMRDYMLLPHNSMPNFARKVLHDVGICFTSPHLWTNKRGIKFLSSGFLLFLGAWRNESLSHLISLYINHKPVSPHIS